MSNFVSQSSALDQSFKEERGKGVIEENEVLVRGEWKRPLSEDENDDDDEEEEEEEDPNDEDLDGETEETVEPVRESEHSCAYCGKRNVS